MYYKKLIVLMVSMLMLVFLIGVSETYATENLIASIAQIPGLADSTEKGTLIDLVKALDEVYEGNIEIKLYPFARSLNNVISGSADFHMPLMDNPVIDKSKQPFKVINKAHGQVPMLVYSNVNNIISKEMIESAQESGGEFPYKIEVAAGAESNVPFPASSSNTIEQSLRKLASGRIDVFLHAQTETDHVLREIKLSSIHRAFYGYFGDVAVVGKSNRGEQVEAILTGLITKLEESGRLQELYKKIHMPYQEWQPADMDW